ncbi:sigma-70 family RNA polymerase sigma factor [bacterium]|nr:sigma-70 family RNA polymerase sigma factor [bacterium]
MDDPDNISRQENEQKLIKLCQQGDSIAFERLYRRFSRDVYNMALKMVLSEEIADEVTQEVFVSIYKNIQKFQFQSAFSTWIYRIVYRRSADYFRKARKHEHNRVDLGYNSLNQNLDFIPDPNPTPLERTVEEEQQVLIEQAIESLAPKQRIIIILRYIQDCSYEEIAQILNCRIGTVKSRLNRAHKLLEEKLRTKKYIR